MLETIITELTPALLSVTAVIISMVKGKNKTNKTQEEIEEIAEAKKQKLVSKLQKKNGVKPIETKVEAAQASQTVAEVAQPSWQKAYGITTQEIKTED